MLLLTDDVLAVSVKQTLLHYMFKFIFILVLIISVGKMGMGQNITKVSVKRLNIFRGAQRKLKLSVFCDVSSNKG